jgi:hypothetical protein
MSAWWSPNDEPIRDPGMFEGQMPYMPTAYEQFMDGFCDDQDGVITVTISWNGAERGVSFIIDEQGFVREV